MKENSQLVGWLEAAIMAGLAFLLGLLPLGIGFYEIECGMVPIIILSFRRGTKLGLAGGFIWGLLTILSGNGVILSPLQVFIEYIFAFALTGLAGLGSTRLQQSLARQDKAGFAKTAALSLIFACFAKYFVHFLAGVVFWSSYAPEGMVAITYSAIVNGLAFLMTSFVNTLIILALLNLAPHLFKLKR